MIISNTHLGSKIDFYPVSHTEEFNCLMKRETFAHTPAADATGYRIKSSRTVHYITRRSNLLHIQIRWLLFMPTKEKTRIIDVCTNCITVIPVY